MRDTYTEKYFLVIYIEIILKICVKSEIYFSSIYFFTIFTLRYIT